MYKSITATWNPLAGQCSHECSYCYVNNLKKRNKVINEKYSGELRLHTPAFKPLGKNKKYFVCSMNDMFQDKCSSDMIKSILEYCTMYPANKYFFQTKNTQRAYDYIDQLPTDSVICTTLETNRKKLINKNTKAPEIFERCIYLSYIGNQGIKTELTIEPIMDFDLFDLKYYIAAANPYIINIGADSKNNNLPEPRIEKVEKLISELKYINNVKVVLKKNLNRKRTF